jgi:putative intracellular protease/amidase
VFYPGGHGQYFDVANDERIAAITAKIYEKGGVIGTAGHGVSSLISIQLSNGNYLVKGKTITCFPTWAEKKYMNISNYGKLLAFDMQEVLMRRGANLIVCTDEVTRSNPAMTNVIDAKNRMVTGAFATSAGWVATEMMKLIKGR